VTSRRVVFRPSWLIFLLPVYVGCRLLPSLATGPVGVSVGIALLAACCAVIPPSMRRRSARRVAFADLLAWIGPLSMGLFSSLFVFTVLRDILLLAAGLILSPGHDASLTLWSGQWTLILAVLVTLGGLVIARRPARIVNVQIPVPDLPSALHGFSIAQISDLHVGPTIKRGFVAGIVRRVNRLGADMIAVTGDLVDGSVRQLSAHTAPLAQLTARHGVYFVTGNHEYYSGERAWTAEIRRLGLHVLKNEHVVLKHDDASLLLAGVTALTAHHFDAAERSDPSLALRGAPADVGARILLAHQPNSAPAAADAGFDVQLSGHTHGGQFWPWNLFVRFFQPFTGGLYRLEKLRVYVSRGTGYWGPPNRFGVPPEITFIRLMPALRAA
jgi:predicted MPP superfamily phosphohydrolase